MPRINTLRRPKNLENQVIWLERLGMNDVEIVGGKNASLGEMIANLSASGVAVPGGFATTASAYRSFLGHDGLDERINSALDALDVDDIRTLAKVGQQIRTWVVDHPFPPELETAIRDHWTTLSNGDSDMAVAVRSSATAEDLPDASFAGQQETYLNVRGFDAVLLRVREVFASLYNDRAISYRVHQGFDHRDVALSAGIQRMVRSDIGAAGVMFTLDTESGFNDVVFITAAYGLGETVVQGSVNPDEFYVYKPALAAGNRSIVRRNLGTKATRMVYAGGGDTSTEEVEPANRARFCLDDADIEALARQAMTIEKHYGRPMDIEWGKDGNTGELYILQARPETVQSRAGRVIERYTLKGHSKVIAEGRSIGQRIGAGTARILDNIEQMDRVQPGDVLVTDITDPDWEPIMKRASAIVTNRGGRTCHAAIIAREMGIPAVVGAGDATQTIYDGQELTVSCAEGDTGFVYDGKLEFELSRIELDSMPPSPVKVTMNVGNPDRAFEFAAIPNRGVGLARLEFIIARMIGIHPRALLEFDQQDEAIKAQITKRTAGYSDPVEFYISKLTEGVSTITAAFAPEAVIVRLSDFKSNEYRSLIGGERYEPEEENPMLGFRGAARYVDPSFTECFALECQAMLRVRRDMGLKNLWLMVPFIRTVQEAKNVIELLGQHGLRRGEDGLKIVMMCELPANALLAEDFLEHFDGFSIGSNDLTQLTLGLDRDSGLIADQFDERDPAVRLLIARAIEACNKAGKYVGICGQGPSDHPDLARWLVEQGIESVSLNPDTVVETWLYLAGEEAKI
jgi:pyruvate, water dikinase